MKALRRSIALLFAFTLMSLVASGQKGFEDGSKYGHGEDSVQCIMNYSLYREYVKQAAYKDAYPYWKICFHDCPLVSKNLYIDGAKLMKEFIENTNDAQRQERLVDSLMILYDQRIQFFPSDEGRVNGYKGIDLLRYRRDDPEMIAQALGFLEKELDLLKLQATPASMASFMTYTITLYKADKLAADVVINNYAKVIDLVDRALASHPADGDLQMVKDNVEQNFAASGAATCESLIALFEPLYEKNKTNIDYLKRATKLLNENNCIESSIFRKASESLFHFEPSAESAYNLSKLFKLENRHEKVSEYLRKAIEMEANELNRSRYYVELGEITLREFGNNALARDYARKAIQADPGSGYPYLLLGNIYVSSRDCETEEFKKDAIYWLAVDQFIKAKSLNEDLKEVADRSISQYSSYFPDVEAIFFNGYKEGDEYTVECWINEKTRVRAR